MRITELIKAAISVSAYSDSECNFVKLALLDGLRISKTVKTKKIPKRSRKMFLKSFVTEYRIMLCDGPSVEDSDTYPRAACSQNIHKRCCVAYFMPVFFKFCMHFLLKSSQLKGRSAAQSALQWKSHWLFIHNRETSNEELTRKLKPLFSFNRNTRMRLTLSLFISLRAVHSAAGWRRFTKVDAMGRLKTQVYGKRKYRRMEYASTEYVNTNCDSVCLSFFVFFLCLCCYRNFFDE